MRNLLFLLFILITCSGCSIFSGYALSSRTAEDLKAEVRKSIVDESVARCKEYTDSVCSKRN